MGSHPAVDMIPPGQRKAVPIDREIAPLIGTVWALGIETHACCQDFQDSGSVQIAMPSCADAHLFLTVVARHAGKDVARHAARIGWRSDWELGVWSVGWERGKFTRLTLYAAVYFPRDHLAEVVRALAVLAPKM